MCFQRTSTEMGFGGQHLKGLSPLEFGRGLSFLGPSLEDVRTIQAVQYATGLGVTGWAAGMTWLALGRGRHLGGTYVY